jgi:hypothetical protein
MDGLSEVSRSSPASDSRLQQNFREGHVIYFGFKVLSNFVFLRFVVLVQDPSTALNLKPRYSFLKKYKSDVLFFIQIIELHFFYRKNPSIYTHCNVASSKQEKRTDHNS